MSSLRSASGTRSPIPFTTSGSWACGFRGSRAELAERRRDGSDFLDSPLTGKYRDRKINDHTFINFADLILNDLEDAAYNIPKIRASLSIMKDGQAVFTNLEKVYLYRYVFTKGHFVHADPVLQDPDRRIPDADIAGPSLQMMGTSKSSLPEEYAFPGQASLDCQRLSGKGHLLRGDLGHDAGQALGAAEMLLQVHEVMPAIMEETGVLIRFLAAIRRFP